MRLLSSVTAIILLCAAPLPAIAASAAPGSVEPADATRSNPPPSAANPAPPAATDNSNAAAPEKAAAAEKKVKKAKVRKHRYARYRTWRHGFIIPPPQYWFRPWPRYRAYRGHRRHYARFPFHFRFGW